MSKKTVEQLQAELDAAKAENKALKKTGPVILKVGQSGAVSAYLGGRFPCTLYADQWGKLLDSADVIRAFIAENTEAIDTVLTAKQEAKETARELKADKKASKNGELTVDQTAKINALLEKGVEFESALKAAKMLA